MTSNRTKLSLALLAALAGTALSLPVQAVEYQLRSYSKGVKAEPPREVPPPETAPAPPAPARFVITGNPALEQSFGDVAAGGASAQPIAISVLNEGQAAGSLAVPSFTGAQAGDFSASTNCSSVPGGGACEVAVEFNPQGSGFRSAAISVLGTPFVFSGTVHAESSYAVLSTGSAYTIPSGVFSVTAWAVGAGGGGAGSAAVDGTSGGGGAAGGLASASFAVQPGQIITYSFGVGGTGGVGGANGNPGTDTILNYREVALQAQGGRGGYFNNSTMSLGGTWSGPGTGVNGGTGGGTAGDRGGAGGGAVGGAGGTHLPNISGGPGARGQFDVPLTQALTSLRLISGSPGAGANSGSSGTANSNNGYPASGFGNGGGGAGYYGGNGGDGIWGGGGGGAAGYTATQRGGSGGNGIIVLKLN